MICPQRQIGCPEQCPGPVRFELFDSHIVDAVPICRVDAATQFVGYVKSFAGLLPIDVVRVVPDEVFMNELARELHEGAVKALRVQREHQKEVEKLITTTPNVIDIRGRLKVS